MAKKAEPGTRDMFMNFADITGTTGPAGNTVMSFELSTGLSIRGMLIWLVHMVQFMYGAALTNNFHGVNVAVSTRKGLTLMPEIGDDGLVYRGIYEFNGATASGAYQTLTPVKETFLPPIPLAAPALYLYVQGTAAHADGVNKPVRIRLGFTTSPLDAAAYTEVAEVWGW